MKQNEKVIRIQDFQQSSLKNKSVGNNRSFISQPKTKIIYFPVSYLNRIESPEWIYPDLSYLDELWNKDA